MAHSHRDSPSSPQSPLSVPPSCPPEYLIDPIYGDFRALTEQPRLRQLHQAVCQRLELWLQQQQQQSALDRGATAHGGRQSSRPHKRRRSDEGASSVESAVNIEDQQRARKRQRRPRLMNHDTSADSATRARAQPWWTPPTQEHDAQYPAASHTLAADQTLRTSTVCLPGAQFETPGAASAHRSTWEPKRTTSRPQQLESPAVTPPQADVAELHQDRTSVSHVRDPSPDWLLKFSYAACVGPVD